MTRRETSQSDMAFFETRVFRPETPCWNWRAYVGQNGYGKWVRSDRQASAHRIAYELFVGPIPEGMQIHHACFNRSCVNPAHLEAVTPKENKAASLNIAAINAAKTHCAQGHPFDEANTVITKRGRTCRTCRNEASRRAHEAKRRRRGQRDMRVECKNGHPRTPENTYVTPSTGIRTCKLCLQIGYLKPCGYFDPNRKRPTHCKHGHEFTPENTYLFTRDGHQYRSCRTCGRESALRRYYAKKAAN